MCGIDQQGCGFSEGLECYVERFHYYVDDVLQFARCVSDTCIGSCCKTPAVIIGLRPVETSSTLNERCCVAQIPTELWCPGVQ